MSNQTSTLLILAVAIGLFVWNRIPVGAVALGVALAILLGMVLLMAFDLVPPVAATLLAVIAMVVLRVLPVEQAHRAINWPTLIIVGGMTPLSLAITRSGVAESISNKIVDLTGDGSPYFILLGLFVVSAILGQMISNTATALIVLPIAITVAADAGISAVAVLICVNAPSTPPS